MNSQYTKSGITEFMNLTKIHVCGTRVGLIQYKNKRVGLDFFPLGEYSVCSLGCPRIISVKQVVFQLKTHLPLPMV